MGTLTDIINDVLNMDPPGTIAAHNDAVYERQTKDRQTARQSLAEARKFIDADSPREAIAHALIGILALQMSET